MARIIYYLAHMPKVLQIGLIAVSIRKTLWMRLLILVLVLLILLAISSSIEVTMKSVLVTGANSGIGFALSKRLITEKGCFVYMGARSKEKGAAAVQKLLSEFPEAVGKLEMVDIDVCDQASIDAAASSLKDKGVVLDALVNNAGVGLAQEGVRGAEHIVDTNYGGPHRVTKAMEPLINKATGRIVNVSSGAASAFVKTQSEELKKLFSNPDLTKDELDSCVKAQMEAGNVGWGNGYGISKAALSALTLVQAKAYAPLKVMALSPGFIDTAMTKGLGAKLSAEEGCKSLLHCLFSDEVVSGCYYGSDGLRSPFTMTRDPGTPEYQGEENPEQETYNK